MNDGKELPEAPQSAFGMGEPREGLSFCFPDFSLVFSDLVWFLDGFSNWWFSDGFLNGFPKFSYCMGFAQHRPCRGREGSRTIIL